MRRRHAENDSHINDCAHVSTCLLLPWVREAHCGVCNDAFSTRCCNRCGIFRPFIRCIYRQKSDFFCSFLVKNNCNDVKDAPSRLQIAFDNHCIIIDVLSEEQLDDLLETPA